MKEITSIEKEGPSQITLFIDNIWIIKVSEEGIQFNRNQFPKWNPDDFALEFMQWLEKFYLKNMSISAKFDKKN